MLNIQPLYITQKGGAYIGDSIDLLRRLPDSYIDLVMTSPPFALRRQKSYGNVEEAEYVDWIKPFAREIFRVLKDTGSFVLDLGGAYQLGKPSRSLYNFRVLLAFCDDIGFKLAQDFYWFNPSKLPSPIEWVNKRKIRVKDSVNTVWWFSKSDSPKSNVKNVLVPYSKRMQKLISNPATYYKPKKRPSGHDIGANFGKNNGGAIPSNLLVIPNTESNSIYIRLCKKFNFECHPARFPIELPTFFIKMLTDEQDAVLDIFAGSNTTGFASECLNRRWLSFESNHEYLVSSVFRFLEGKTNDEIKTIIYGLMDNQANFQLETIQCHLKSDVKLKLKSLKINGQALLF